MQCWICSFLSPWPSLMQGLCESYGSCQLQRCRCLPCFSLPDWWGKEEFGSSNCNFLPACSLYLHLKRCPKWKLPCHLHCTHLQSDKMLFRPPKRSRPGSSLCRCRFWAILPRIRLWICWTLFEAKTVCQRLWTGMRWVWPTALHSEQNSNNHTTDYAQTQPES